MGATLRLRQLVRPEKREGGVEPGLQGPRSVPIETTLEEK